MLRARLGHDELPKAFAVGGGCMVQQHSGWPEARELRGLVREAQRGVPNALNALLGALRPALVAFFSRRLSSDIAEDLAQSALLRIAGALPRIDPERADSYLNTVARNLLRTSYRRRIIDQRRHSDIELSSLISDSQSIEAAAEYKELTRTVHGVVRTRLPEPLAEVILSLLHGETAAEIAGRLGLSPITVRTRLMRARTILRQELRPYLLAQPNREPRKADAHSEDRQSVPG